jgi:hypothetical protein
MKCGLQVIFAFASQALKKLFASIFGSAMIDDFSQLVARSRRLTSSRHLNDSKADLSILITQSQIFCLTRCLGFF